MEIPPFKSVSLHTSSEGSDRQAAWNKAWQRFGLYASDRAEAIQSAPWFYHNKDFQSILEGLEPYAKAAGGGWYDKFEELRSDFIIGKYSSLKQDVKILFFNTPPVLTPDQIKDAAFLTLDKMKDMVRRGASEDEVEVFNEILAPVVNKLLIPPSFWNYMETSFSEAYDGWAQSPEHANKLIAVIDQLQTFLK